MAQPVETEDMPGKTRSSASMPYLGDLKLDTPRGPVAAAQAPGLATSHITGVGQPTVQVLVHGSTDGLYVLLTPEGARLAAAGLLRSADAAEAGYGEEDEHGKA